MSDGKPASKGMKRLTRMPDHRAYAVGHGKPPQATRFKPGQSGNPKGRPTGKRNKGTHAATQHERLKAIILEEAYRNIKVNDGERQVTIPMAQAVMRSLAVTAAKGNTRAQKVFAELLSETEASNKNVEDEWLETAIQYKARWERELERRKRHRINNLPDPLPHPDDVIIDYRQNRITIRGPMDKQELADLDLWLNRKNDNEAELQYIKNSIKDQKNLPYLKQFERDIAHTKRILEIIDMALAQRASPHCIERRLSQLNLTTPDYLLTLAELELLEQPE